MSKWQSSVIIHSDIMKKVLLLLVLVVFGRAKLLILMLVPWWCNHNVFHHCKWDQSWLSIILFELVFETVSNFFIWLGSIPLCTDYLSMMNGLLSHLSYYCIITYEAYNLKMSYWQPCCFRLRRPHLHSLTVPNQTGLLVVHQGTTANHRGLLRRVKYLSHLPHTMVLILKILGKE